MTTPLQMECPSASCLNPENPLGREVCDRCQTPLVYRYLWVVGEGVDLIAPGTCVGDRFLVTTPKIWLDLQPARSPLPPATLPDGALPYLHLFPHRLHLPTLFSVCSVESINSELLLLENAPITPMGQLLPTVSDLWEQVVPLRRLNWLWQSLSLWTPLKEQGLAASLLRPDNICVEGWRIRLKQLIPDEASTSLAELAQVWSSWLTAEDDQLQPLCQAMQGSTSEDDRLQEAIATLNSLILQESSQSPLKLSLSVATSTGPQRTHNEDACYPSPALLPAEMGKPRLAMICDGIGGHAGGEVASQMAIRSLELQLLALLTETTEQPEPVLPEVIAQQIQAVIRVVNNMIAVQNDEQGRELRQRMGTTLVLALQLPQAIATSEGSRTAHELYLAHIGDSRAYWITSRYCHLLTVDDDVATREVKLGHSLYRDALQRSDAGALTQALGTREAEALSPNVQRFMVDEDGLLLLCSDGLSDNELIERSWQEVTTPFFKETASLEAIAQSWIDLANQHNGHDNASLALLHCQISHTPRLFTPPKAAPQPAQTSPTAEAVPSPPAVEIPASETAQASAESAEVASDWSEASRALLEAPPAATIPDHLKRKPKPLNVTALTIGLIALMFTTGMAGILAWRQIDPLGFQQTWQRITNPR